MTEASATKPGACSATIAVTPGGLMHPADRAESGLAGTWRKHRWQILISSTWVRERIAGLAREITRSTRAVKGDRLNLLVVLDGGDYFGRRLARAIRRAGGLPPVLHFVKASSYGAARRSSGRCRISGNIARLAGKDVIVVDDICDTGLTLMKIRERLAKNALAAPVKTCVLFDKPKRRLARLAGQPADFIGFKVPDYFLAGCGMDLGTEARFRRLPYVIALMRNPRRRP